MCPHAPAGFTPLYIQHADVTQENTKPTKTNTSNTDVQTLLNQYCVCASRSRRDRNGNSCSVMRMIDFRHFAFHCQRPTAESMKCSTSMDQTLRVFFYRAMHLSAKRGIAIACRLYVRLSVTLVNCDHIGWNSSKIISPLVSLGCSLFATPT